MAKGIFKIFMRVKGECGSVIQTPMLAELKEDSGRDCLRDGGALSSGSRLQAITISDSHIEMRFGFDRPPAKRVAELAEQRKGASRSEIAIGGGEFLDGAR